MAEISRAIWGSWGFMYSPPSTFTSGLHVSRNSRRNRTFVGPVRCGNVIIHLQGDSTLGFPVFGDSTLGSAPRAIPR